MGGCRMVRYPTILGLILLAVTAASDPLRVLNISQPHDDHPMLVAVFSAAGIANADSASVYIIRDDDATSGGALAPVVASRTAFWLNELVASKRNLTHLTTAEFVDDAVAKYGMIIYDIEDGNSFPVALTLAGAHQAV